MQLQENKQAWTYFPPLLTRSMQQPQLHPCLLKPPVPPPQAPVPPPQAPVQTKCKTTDKDAKKTLQELMIVPKDLPDLQPRSTQVWNCDKIRIDPTGKWVKILCTWKWCMSEKIFKCRDGEYAPFWVTVFFFTQADGQCFLAPCIVHKGTEYTRNLKWKIPDD